MVRASGVTPNTARKADSGNSRATVARRCDCLTKIWPLVHQIINLLVGRTLYVRAMLKYGIVESHCKNGTIFTEA